MGKLIGFLFAIIGLALLAIRFVFKANEKLAFLDFIIKADMKWIIGIAIILIVLGFILMKGKKHRVSGEVPIYSGKEVVGFKRV